MFLHTDFSKDDIDLIYTYLGNACNHNRTLEFVRGGYDMGLLRKLENKENWYMKKCVVLEMENKTDFENAMNDYLSDGYKVEASSCNSKYYKAILVLEENN